MNFQTSFWNDFSIADAFGIEAVRDTYDRAFNEWKHDYIYLTELVIVLNWRCWLHHDHNNIELSKVYLDLYEKTNDYAWDNLKGEEQSYFYRMTD